MKAQTIKSLQSMRLFAGIGVAQYHLWQNYFGIAIGQPGTDLFLVLTGLIAAYTQANGISNVSWWKYISGRYKRLYITFIPLFLITLLAKWKEADLAWVLKSFLFIPITDRSPLIGCTWMISMFLLFYFVFSLCFLVKTEKIIWVIFIVWAGFIGLYNLFHLSIGLPSSWENLLFAERNLNFMFGYVVGFLLRKDWLRGHYPIVFLWSGFTGILAGTVLLNVGIHSSGRALTLGIPMALFILGLSSLELQKRNIGIVRFLLSPGLVWLGQTSYVLFLSHSMFFNIWSRILPVTPILALPMSLGAIIAAAFIYAYWEYPVLAYLKSKQWTIPRNPLLGRNKVVSGTIK